VTTRFISIFVNSRIGVIEMGEIFILLFIFVFIVGGLVYLRKNKENY